MIDPRGQFLDAIKPASKIVDQPGGLAFPCGEFTHQPNIFKDVADGV